VGTDRQEGRKEGLLLSVFRTVAQSFSPPQAFALLFIVFVLPVPEIPVISQKSACLLSLKEVKSSSSILRKSLSSDAW